MGKATLAKVAAQRAREICESLELSDPAREILEEEMAPAAYFDRLVAHQLYLDAIRFLAHALPKRESVWWACQSARSVCQIQPDQPAAKALDAAEQWVAEPSEDRRRAAFEAAEKAGFATPAGCAAAAAFWSGGSLGPAHVPEIPPGPTLTAQGVVGSLMLAAVWSEPERAAERHRAFLRRGVEIAEGAAVPGEPSS